MAFVPFVFRAAADLPRGRRAESGSGSASRMSPILDEAALARAVAHGGDGVRFGGAFVDRLAARLPVSIAVVGGSISAGTTFTALRGRKASWLWWRRFVDWLSEAHPPADGAKHTIFNGALPASTPAYVETCLTLHVPSGAHLVLLEYAANFDDAPSYERLLRRALSLPGAPAVLALNMPLFWPSHLPRTLPPAPSAVTRADLMFSFDVTMAAETRILELTQYYGVPSLSLRNAFYHAVRGNATAGFRLHDLLKDRVHPKARTHAIAAEVLGAFTEAQLARRRALARAHPPAPSRAHSWASSRSATPLPPPMHGDRADAGADGYICVRGEALRHLVLNSSRGFGYVVEGDTLSNPKPGLVATTAGSHLDLCWTPPPGWSSSSGTALKLGYLTSFERVGTAALTCSGVCGCNRTEIDGRSVKRRSVHQVASLMVRPVPSAPPVTPATPDAPVKSARWRRREGRGGRRRRAVASRGGDMKRGGAGVGVSPLPRGGGGGGVPRGGPAGPSSPNDCCVLRATVLDDRSGEGRTKWKARRRVNHDTCAP